TSELVLGSQSSDAVPPGTNWFASNVAAATAVAREDRKPGQPIGEKARWRILFEAMKDMKPGHIILYEVMGEVLGLDHVDPSQKSAIGVAARKAVEELRRTERRVFKIVRGHGYQCAQPSEVLSLVQQHQERAITEARAGAEKTAAVDVSRLDPTTRRLFEATAISLSRQQDLMGQLDVRQQKLQS